MAFNLYLAGSYAARIEEILMDKGINRLYSQLNDRSLGEKWITYSREVEHRQIFVDSGAFSVHTKGKTLDVDKYIEYLNERAGSYTVIAQVDQIPGEFGKPKTLEQLAEAPDKSWENYLYMRERVIDKDCLTPIFHQGEDFKHLKRMLEWTDESGKHIPYIGISPANDVSTKHKETWFSLVFRIIRDSSNPNVKTHAFGMTSLPILEKYPFWSADSTSWIMTSANGGIFTPYGIICCSDVQMNDPKHISHLTPKKLAVIEQQLSKFGITVEECREDYAKRGLNNALYLMEWAKNYEFKGNKSYQKKLF